MADSPLSDRPGGPTPAAAADEVLGLVFESAPDAIVVTGSDGRICRTNALAERIFGYGCGGLVGLPVELLVAEGDRARIRSCAACSPGGGSTQPGEMMGRRQDGTEFPVDILWSPVGHTGPAGPVLFIRDVSVRKRAEEALRGTEEIERRLVEAEPDSVLVVDSAGVITRANQMAEQMFGYTRAELVGAPVEILIPASARTQHVHDRAAYMKEPRMRPMGIGLDLRARRKDGSEFPVDIMLSPFKGNGSGGRLVRTVVRDITERREAEEKAKEVLKKEILLKEIHHRVKNNLQVVSSLLNLQSRHVADRRAKDMLLECQDRVRSMALIHEKFYLSDDIARVDISDYLRDLTGHLFRTYGVDAGRIRLHVEAARVPLSMDTAIPCGLIVNELVTNALKHAFAQGRSGEVRVELHAESDGRMVLTVQDDGVGLPKEMDLLQARTFGLQLVHTMARQMEGEVNVESSDGVGSRIRIRFTEPNYGTRA